MAARTWLRPSSIAAACRRSLVAAGIVLLVVAVSVEPAS